MQYKNATHTTVEQSNSTAGGSEKGKNTVGTESLKVEFSLECTVTLVIFLSTLNPTKLQATEMLLVLLKKEIKGDKEQIFVISKSLENGITTDHPDPNQFSALHLQCEGAGQ
uniref:Uncharacterized protein n=1 Tax=Oryza meridionalis TaxID=40149 RepID=A0A0E0F8I6_9ORYZ